VKDFGKTTGYNVKEGKDDEWKGEQWGSGVYCCQYMSVKPYPTPKFGQQQSEPTGV